jgi:hypothetical protein
VAEKRQRVDAIEAGPGEGDGTFIAEEGDKVLEAVGNERIWLDNVKMILEKQTK